MLELLFSGMGMLRNRFRDTIQLHRLINPSSVGLMENQTRGKSRW